MPTLPVPRSSSAPAAGNRRPAARLLQPLGRLVGVLFGELLAFTGSVFGGALLGLLVTIPLFWFLDAWQHYDLHQGPPAPVGAGAVLGGLAWLGQTWQRLWQGDGHSHGSARFATKAETRDLLTDSGLLIGRDRAGRGLLRYAGAAHLLTLAPTRSGKGTGSILPNLLTAKRSLITVDPKGENARIAGAARAKIGRLLVLDPFALTPWPSATYNPLAALEPASLDLAEDAATLANALVLDPPAQVQDAHWNEEAKALLAGLILLVICHEDPPQRHLGTLREHLTLPPDRFAALLALMQGSTAAHGLIARAANRHLAKSEREAAGVLSSAQRHTHFLDSPRLRQVLTRSDFRFAELKHRPTSVFLVLPPDRLDTYSRWLRLLLAQGISEIARDPAQPKEPVLFLLDEFAALGHLTAIERAMGLMAGYGLQLWPILQDLSQLESLYGRRAATFTANAGVLQAFNVNDLQTAKWLSELVGETTVPYQTQSRSRSFQPFTASWSTSRTTAGHLIGRRLLTPDEVLRLDPDLMLLKLQGRRPLLARKLRYHQDPEFKGLFDPATR